jgi:dinuclear metal center YbgI/SA1388 family protein
MKVREIAALIEQMAPPEIAWERDNVGLQVGRGDDPVRGVLVSLEVTDAVISEARRRRASLIVSHHPLVFRPLRAVATDTPEGRRIAGLLRYGIALYAAHTNLDFAAGGTSFALAELLGIRGARFLRTPYRMQKKIVTFVPGADVERVAAAMAGAGAGVIGNYDSCSFRIGGEGTFRGNAAANPAVGRRGTLERVREVRLEMVVPGPGVTGVVAALCAAHPYEEVAYDVYPVDTPSLQYGMGVVGELERPVQLRVFLQRVRRSLGIPHLRYTGDQGTTVRRVAVCGGSGADLLPAAIAAGADAFVTADVKYHAFHDSSRAIALIDAGHYETEVPVVHSLARRLAARLRGKGIPVSSTRVTTNPVRWA